MNKLVILDRDGVINKDSTEFIKTPVEWHPIDRSLEAISLLNSKDWLVAVATNQSGIARGLLTIDDLAAIHSKMQDSLSTYQAHIDFLTFCPHAPWDLCNCRKPLPGMYRRISDYFNVPTSAMVVIGDSIRDLQAAVVVGAHPILVKTGNGLTSLLSPDLPANTLVFDDLFEAVIHLTK